MFKSIVTAISLAVAATGASAASLMLDYETPSSFSTGATYGNVWNKTFDFTVDQGATVYLTVFDFWKSGDQFTVTVNDANTGDTLIEGVTSTPGIGGKITHDGAVTTADKVANYMDALASPLFSNGEVILTEGSYSVTGALFASPRAESNGRIWLTSQSLGADPLTLNQLQRIAPALPPVVPLPAAGWMLIAALTGLGMMRRKS